MAGEGAGGQIPVSYIQQTPGGQFVPDNRSPPAVCVKVGVGEAEPCSLELADYQVARFGSFHGVCGYRLSSCCLVQGLSAGEVIGRLIERVGLGGDVEDYQFRQTVNGGQCSTESAL